MVNSNYDMEYTILLAGNPNVGKSTLFNALTGMKQHTGNWAGKTVDTAKGLFFFNNTKFNIYDLPGIYSFDSSSPDEKAAANALLSFNFDCVCVVADASSPEKGLNLILQILQFTDKIVVCFNLSDEAERKGIVIDYEQLSLQLGVPVIKTSAKNKMGLDNLKKSVWNISSGMSVTNHINSNFFCVSNNTNKYDFSSDISFNNKNGIIHKKDFFNTNYDKLFSELSELRIKRCNEICKLCVKYSQNSYSTSDKMLDHIFTSRLFGIPVMLLLFAAIFYITIIGANYPSQMLGYAFSNLGKCLDSFFSLFCPLWLKDLLINGIYSTLSNVISVMLPPMAIFFPLFSFLEDLGYLPRVSFNLDGIFRKCGSNGKQGITMLMVYIIL